MANAQQASAYNYSRFDPRILGKDMKLIREPAGPLPGDECIDFELEDVDGKTWKLSELKGKSVVLMFGSGTCPLTAGSLPGLKKLHREQSIDAQWLFVYVREAHPGDDFTAHQSYEQKRMQAGRLRAAESIAWPVLVDRLDGTVHESYGSLPNHLFLIDAQGRVAFRGEMAHAPTLARAMKELAEEGSPVRHSHDAGIHMLGATAYGWSALSRGGRLSQRDVMQYAPPLGLNLLMGRSMRPLLDPIAGRGRRLPATARWAMSGAGAALLMLAVRRLLKRF